MDTTYSPKFTAAGAVGSEEAGARAAAAAAANSKPESWEYIERAATTRAGAGAAMLFAVCL
jgi:hypothetical protein